MKRISPLPSLLLLNSCLYFLQKGNKDIRPGEGTDTVFTVTGQQGAAVDDAFTLI